MVRIGIAGSDFGYNLRDLPWGVAFISVLAIVSIELRKLREIGIARERFLDSLAVEDVGIGGQLDAVIGHAAPKIAHEELHVCAGPLANQECGNQLRVRVQRNENPLVPELNRIGLSDMPRRVAHLFVSFLPRYGTLDARRASTTSMYGRRRSGWRS